MKMTWTAATVVALAIPATAAMAQTTGTSHPDMVPITTSPDGIQQPVVYQPYNPGGQPYTPSTAPAMQTRPPAPATAAKMPAAIATPTIAPTAQPDLDGNIVTRLPGPSNELPIGTMMKVRLNQEISTASTPQGTIFTGELLESVERDGRVLLPAGSLIAGKVTDIHGGRRISGAASIHLRPDTVTLPDGTRYKLHGQVIDTSLFHQTKVDEEGTIIRRDHKAATASVLGLSAGGGAAAGAMVAGVPGALIGAGVGAGVGTAVWLKESRQTALPTNTKIIFSLTSPLSFEGMANGNAGFTAPAASRPIGEMR